MTPSRAVVARFSIRHNLALLLSGIGVVLGILGLVLSWWEAEIKTGGELAEEAEGFFGSRSLSVFTAGPFDTEGNQDRMILQGAFLPLDPAADDEANMIGWFLVIGLVALVATVGLVVSGYFFPVLQPWMMHAPSILALVMGGVSIGLAPAMFPDAFADEANDYLGPLFQEFGLGEIQASWFGEYKPAAAEGMVWMDYSPSAGWWLSIFGFIVVPGASAAVHLFAKGLDTPRQEPAAEYLPPAATPPPALPTGSVFHGGVPSDAAGQRKRFVATPSPAPATSASTPASVPSHYSTSGYSTEAPANRYANPGYSSPIEQRTTRPTGYSSPVAPPAATQPSAAPSRKHLSVVKPAPAVDPARPQPAARDPRKVRKT